MRFAFVPFVVFAASLTFASDPSATIDPSAAYYKIDMSRPPAPPTPVYVVNFPDTQAVSGTVSVDNLPAVQPVSGTVAVSNLPAVQTVGGNVAVSNLPLDAGGALRLSCPTVRFIGVTTTAIAGNAGWRNLNLACSSQFGATYPTVRMCTSKDILQTPVIQWPSLPGNAWVQPVIVSAALVNSGPITGGFVDISGLTTTYPDWLSCNGWSTRDNSGLALLSTGGFGFGTCAFASTFVTCCADATP